MRLEKDNYDEHVKTINFRLYGIEDDQSNQIKITYYSSWDDDKYGFYISEQQYDSFEDAYTIYISMK